MKRDNSFKVFKDCIEKLKNDWYNNIKPFIEFDKNQGRRYDKFIQEGDHVIKREPEPKDHIQTFWRIPPAELYDIYNRVYTDEDCDGSPYDVMGELTGGYGITPSGEKIPININGRVLSFNEGRAKYFEQRKMANILKSFFFQQVQKIAVEVERAMLIVCCKRGYTDERFTIAKFYAFSDNIRKGSEAKIKKFPKYKAFDLLLTMNNFLKHNSISAYKELKKFYPDNIDRNNATVYENGMYAGDFIYLQEGYLDKIFDKLLIFFAEYCKVILGEEISDEK